MASKVDLGQQIELEKVSHLPPRPPALFGGFHNRGRLFSTVKQQQLSATTSAHEPKDESVSELASAGEATASASAAVSKPPYTPAGKDRVQSAQARLERSQIKNGCVPPSELCGQLVSTAGRDVAVYDVNMNLAIERPRPDARRRRSSGGTSGTSGHSFERAYRDRPSSAKSGNSWSSTPVSPAVEEEGKKVPENLKPSVYGYRFKRQVYGSNPDIFSADFHPAPPESVQFRLDKTPERQMRKPKRDGTEDFIYSQIPSHMEPLRPWLTDTVSKDVIGVDPATCLVFLPLNQEFDNLPIVPFL